MQYNTSLPWVFMDVDSTLIPLGGRLSPRNRKALMAYSAAGGRVSLASGKHPGAIRPICERLGLRGPHIAGNGAVFLWEGRVRVHKELGAHAEVLYRRLLADRIPLACFTSSGIYLRYALPHHAALLTAIERPVPVYDSDPGPGPLFKILTFVDRSERERERILTELAGELGLDTVRTADPYFEFIPPGTSKGAAAELILEAHSWPRERSVGMGDSENDLTLLQSCGRGVAMGNALPMIRAAADEIISECDADGVGEYIEKLLIHCVENR